MQTSPEFMSSHFEGSEDAWPYSIMVVLEVYLVFDIRIVIGFF